MVAGQWLRERHAAGGDFLPHLRAPAAPHSRRHAGVAGLALAAGLAALAAGCGERLEPTGAEAPLYPVTVQGAGPRPAVVRKAPRRIAAFGAGMAAVLTALGVGEQLVEVGRGDVQPDADLLVAWSSSDATGLARAARGRRLYLAPDGSIRQVQRGILELGLLVGRPLRARELVAEIESRRRQVTALVAGRPAVTVFLDLGFFTTLSDRSLAGDLIRQAGGRSVAGPTPEPGPFNLAELARLDPDVYIATADSGVTLAALRADPRTQRLRAVRSGRFGTIPSRLLEPGPRLGESLEALARILHPDAF